MATQVGSLYTSLTLDSASFVSNMKRAATAAETAGSQISKALSTAKTVAVGFAGAFVTGQLLDLAKEASTFASSLGETAEQLGISSKGLQELRYAATQSGASIEEADKAIGKFSVNVGKARDGNKQLRDAFDNVGVGFNDLRRLNTEQLFAKVADGIAKIPDPARRASAEVALLGKGGQALGVVLNSGADGIRAFADQAERAGVVVSDKAITALDDLNDSGDRLKLVFNAQLANLIGNNAGAILSLGAAAADAIGKVGGFLNQMRGVAALLQRGDIFGTITNSEQQLEKLGTAQGIAAYDAALVTKLEKQAADKAGKFEIAIGRSTAKQLAEARRTAEASKFATLDDIFPVRSVAAANTSNFAVADTPGGKPKAARAQKEVGDSAKSLQADLKRLLGQYDETAAAALRYATELEDIDKLQKGGVITPFKATRLRDEALDRRTAVDRKDSRAAINDTLSKNEDQLKAGLKDPGELVDLKPLIGQYKTLSAEAQYYFDSLPKTATQIRDTFEGVGVHALDSLESGLTGLITGTESLGDAFSSVAKSIIADLAQVAIRILIVTPLAQALQSALTGLGFGGGGTSAGASTGAGAGLGFNFDSVPVGAYALGGDPPVGKVSLVGERGPELFVPKSAGTIIPNNILRGSNDNARQSVDVHVTTDASPLLVSTVTVGAQRAGALEAQRTIAAASRRSIPRGRI